MPIDRLTLAEHNEKKRIYLPFLGSQERLFLCFLHLSSSRVPVSFTFLFHAPLLLPRASLGEFPSETHPDFPLILPSPSVTFPPLCSLQCLFLHSHSRLACLPHHASSLSHGLADLSFYRLICIHGIERLRLRRELVL